MSKRLGEVQKLRLEDGQVLELAPFELTVIPADDYGARPESYAIRYLARNPGPGWLSNDFSSGCVLIDEAGRQYDEPSWSTPWLRELHLPAGASRIGIIPFEVGTDTAVAEVQITLDFGYGPDTGLWSLSQQAATPPEPVPAGEATKAAGSTQRLAGEDGDLEARPLRVIDLSEAVRDPALAGARLFGVEFEVTSRGSRRWEGDLNEGACVVDEQGVVYPATPVYERGPFLSSMLIPSDSKRTGFLCFALPPSRRPAIVQLSQRKDIGSVVCEWRLDGLGSEPAQPTARSVPVRAENVEAPAPRREPQPVASTPSAPPGPVVDLNAADEPELAALPGVGAVLAKRLVGEREQRGGFSSIEEAIAVLDLKPHLAARFIDQVTLGERPEPASAELGRGRVIDL